jgi:hypothetical protein
MPTNEAEHERWTNYNPHDINIWHERWLPREKNSASVVKSERSEAGVIPKPETAHALVAATSVEVAGVEVAASEKPEASQAVVAVSGSSEPMKAEPKAGISIGMIALLVAIVVGVLFFILTRRKDEGKP